MIDNGFVYIPETAAWFPDYLHETVFPKASTTTRWIRPRSSCLYEHYRQLAQATVQAGKSQPPQTVFARGSMEWLAAQKQAS